MKHRIFIAINLPEIIKKEIGKYQKKFQEIPARWTKPENIHITLIFLGYVEENKIEEIKSLIKKIAFNYKNFEVNLEKIIYGPPLKPPRMIWITIKKNGILFNLQKELKNTFLKNGILPEKENREFSPHITLCRFNTHDFKKIKNPPIVNQKINLNFITDSIDLMESKLFKTGAKYSIIEKIKLLE